MRSAPFGWQPDSPETRKGGPMLAVGDVAPDFTEMTHEGAPLTLSELRGRHVLLWFYPKADTPG